MKIGLERDDGSDSEPSVDNIKFDRLAELNQRKCMRINTNIVKPTRPYKSAVNSGNIHKVTITDANSRPKTGYPSRNKNLGVSLDFD